MTKTTQKILLIAIIATPYLLWTVEINLRRHDVSNLKKHTDHLTSRLELLEKTNSPDIKPVLHQAGLTTSAISILNDITLDTYIAGADSSSTIVLPQGSQKTIARSAAVKWGEIAANVPYDDLNNIDAGTSSSGKHSEPIERVLAQKGNILLPKGRWQFEPSLTWAHFSSNKIHIQGFSVLPVLVIGDISTRKIKRDIFINTYSFKYGLLNNLQTELKIPFRFEYDRETDTSALTEDTSSSAGLGDIEFGLSRQIGWEHGLMPDLVAAISVKSNSGKSYNETIALGTGHWSLKTSLIAAKSSDPTVIFGSLSHTYTFSRDDIEDIGKIEPGQSLGYSLGTAIALSYKTAINFSFDHSIIFQTKQNNNDLEGSFLNIASFKTGLNWAIDENSSIDLGLTMGITDDAADVVLELRFPHTF